MPRYLEALLPKSRPKFPRDGRLCLNLSTLWRGEAKRRRLNPQPSTGLMADVFSKRKRSEVMSRIRSRGNKDTELAFAKLLRAAGICGWRRHLLIRATVESCWLRVESRKQKRSRNPQPSTINPQLAVRPDFVFRKQRMAIFVDGCFWHGCPKHCKYAKWLTQSVTANNPPSPKNRLRRTGRAFWLRKLAGNKTRDRVVNRTLRRAGWRVVRIWECELQSLKAKRSTPHLASGHPLPGRGGEGEARLMKRLKSCLKNKDQL